MKPKTHDHPKPVKYPEVKERDSLAESIYAHAVGAWIRDTCHRPSIPDVEFERIAKMAVHAAELFRGRGVGTT
jgi:hypothetical protein